MSFWTCPKCQRVWSPDTKGCAPCNESVGRKLGAAIPEINVPSPAQFAPPVYMTPRVWTTLDAAWPYTEPQWQGHWHPDPTPKT